MARRGGRRTKPAVLPGEPNPSSPGGRKPPTPMPTEPSPAGRYKDLKKAFHTPGMQPGEKEAISAIAKHRGVSRSEAKMIGAKRTARGLTTAGISGPNGMATKAPGRTPVKNPKPIGMTRPGPGPKPRAPGSPAPQPGSGAPRSMPGASRSVAVRGKMRPMPKRPAKGTY